MQPLQFVVEAQKVYIEFPSSLSRFGVVVTQSWFGEAEVVCLRVQQGAYANGGGTHLLPPVANAIYYGEPTPPGVPATTSAYGLNNGGNTKMSIEAVLAGAIIGKAGANVKQISRLTGKLKQAQISFTCTILELSGAGCKR